MAGAVPDPDHGRRRLAALPGRPRRLLRDRPRPDPSVQPGPHLARPARDLLRLDLVPRRRDLPRADDHRARAEAPALARLRVARRAGDRRLRQPDRRVRRRPRLVRRRRLDLRHPGLRVPRPRPLLAGAARDRALLLGGDPLPGAARTPGAREPGQPALALLLRGARDPGLLRGRAARSPGRQLHRHRLLALLGRPPLGRGLPGAVHDRDGRLRVRPARRGPRARRPYRRLPRHPPLLGRRRDRHDAPPLLLRASPPSTWRSAPSSRPPR